MQAARAEGPKQLAQISKSGCLDGGTYLQWYESPRCNGLGKRCFARNPVSSTQRFHFQASAFVLHCALLRLLNALRLPREGARHTHSAYRSDGGAADTAVGFEGGRHCSGQANPNLCHTEGVTAVRTPIAALRVKELAKRGRRKVRERRRSRRETEKDLIPQSERA